MAETHLLFPNRTIKVIEGSTINHKEYPLNTIIYRPQFHNGWKWMITNTDGCVSISKLPKWVKAYALLLGD